MLGILGIIGGIIGIVGAIATAVGGVQQAQAQAKADELKASQLEDLSKTGGYYDQQLAALDSDLADIESDRAAAGRILALTAAQAEDTAKQQTSQLSSQERAVARQGAQATGSIAAAAGAGNLGQGGSIEARKAGVEGQVQETISMANEQKAYIQRSTERNIEQARIQYEDQLRGLATREAQDTASQTMAEFQKNTGIQDATALRTEADWLNTWGVGFAIAGGVLKAGSVVANTDWSGLTPPSPSTRGTVDSTMYDMQTVPWDDPYSSMVGGSVKGYGKVVDY